MDSGNEKKAPTTRDYVEGLRNISLYPPESTVRGIFAIKAFARNGNEQDILEATMRSWTSHTENILSLQNGKDQRLNIEGAVVRHLCNSKSYEEMTRNNYFKQQVIEPIQKWGVYEGEVSSDEAVNIMKEKTELQQAISGVLWTLHKNELQNTGFNSPEDFANSIFEDSNSSIQPDHYSETLLTDVRAEINDNNMI